MPNDITHCAGQSCRLQETCLRYTGYVYGKQDFFTSSPYNVATHHCDYYWDERPTEEQVRQLAYQLWEKSGYQQNSALAHWFQARKQLIDNLRWGC
jgi:hypothetical protein